MILTARTTHRDLAYFYVGLIISFSFSGIFLNHRKDWYPATYVYESKQIKVEIPQNKDEINDEYIAKLTKQLNINDRLRRFRVEENDLRVSFVNNDVEIDIRTGAGKLENYRTTPILGQMTKLHADTSDWWIYYSDVFGIAMMTIAFTGMFIQKGKNSFWGRGWKLALAGILFPLIFLFLIS